MNFALELRAPFLDRDVMELAAGLDGEDRISGLHHQGLPQALRRALTCRGRSSTAANAVCRCRWRAGCAVRSATGRAAGSTRRGSPTVGIARASALALFDQHDARRGDHARALWTLLVLAEWLDSAACPAGCRLAAGEPPARGRAVSAAQVAGVRRRRARLGASAGIEPRAGSTAAISSVSSRWPLSNGLLALAGLLTPWSVVWREVPWRRFRAHPGAARALLPDVDSSRSPRPTSRAPASARSATRRGLATLVLALLLVRGETAVRRVIGGLVLVASLLAFGGMVQLLAGQGDIDHRIRGPFSHYMTYSGVLLMCDLLLLARLSTPGGWRRRWSWVGFVVINAAILGTLTRGAWVALLLTALGFLASRVFSRGRLPRWLLLGAPAALLLAALAPVPLVHRALSIVDLRDTFELRPPVHAGGGFQHGRRAAPARAGPRCGEAALPDLPQRHRAAAHRAASSQHLSSSWPPSAASSRSSPTAWMMVASLRAAWVTYRAEGGMRGARADLLLGVILALVAFNLAGLFEDNWRDAEVQRVALFLLAVPFGLVARPRPGGRTRRPPPQAR
jgi:hypothetical protein